MTFPAPYSGAPPNTLARTATDQDGNTPLHAAARNGHDEIVKLLIDAGAQIDAPNRYRETPLHWASYSDHPGTSNIIKQLLAAGAPVGAFSKNGWTPLHKAAYWGHPRVARQLLDGGADKNSKTNAGETALDLALKLKRTAVVDVLQGNKTGPPPIPQVIVPPPPTTTNVITPLPPGHQPATADDLARKSTEIQFQEEFDRALTELRQSQKDLIEARRALDRSQQEVLELRSHIEDLKEEVRGHLETAQQVNAHLEQELELARLELQQLKQTRQSC